MYKIQLEVNDNKRWLTHMDYEYFCPVKVSDDYYKKFLYLNFPFQQGDQQDLFPYNVQNIPGIKPTQLDKKLRDEAYRISNQTNALTSSVFQETPKSAKEIYYEKLTRLRYNAGLDYGIIPNLDFLYNRYLKPKYSICRNIEHNRYGGIFNLTLESSSNDDFWYDWMITGQMHNGKLVFYDGDEDLCFKIEFWDCYCIFIGEQMSSIGSSAMTMHMRLSPAITRNRSVEDQKVWKVTDLSENTGTAATTQEVASYDDLYMVDEKNNRIDDVRPGMKIELVIKTSGCIGRSITIDLKNEECDYKYNGKILENDVLSNYTINQNIERIPLEVIEQQ